LWSFFFLFCIAMFGSRPKGLVWTPIWQNFYLGTRRFLLYLVGGWRSHRHNRCLPREWCRLWLGFEPATLHKSTDAIVWSAKPLRPPVFIISPMYVCYANFVHNMLEDLFNYCKIILSIQVINILDDVYVWNDIMPHICS